MPRASTRSTFETWLLQQTIAEELLLSERGGEHACFRDAGVTSQLASLNKSRGKEDSGASEESEYPSERAPVCEGTCAVEHGGFLLSPAGRS